MGVTVTRNQAAAPAPAAAAAPRSPGEQFLEAAGVHIEGRGAPLLLINGLLHGQELWERLVRHLATGRRTIRFDFPHQNGSPFAKAYSGFERYCDFVQDLLAALRLEPAETEAFGFSIGGDVLRALVVQRGLRFRHVIMGASAPPGVERFWKEFFDSALACVRRGQIDTLVRLIAFQFYSPVFIERYPKLLNVMHLKFLQRFADRSLLEALLEMPLQRPRPDPLRDTALRGDTTLVHSLFDQLAPIGLSREYARRVGLPIHEVETGHSLLAEAPDEVARVAIAVLNQGGMAHQSRRAPG